MSGQRPGKGAGKRAGGGRGRPGASNRLRIIAGRWRGRRLRFPDVPGLRPSGDRLRETLFNWLQADVPGARCLDLFAGAGALGLEALSRGAQALVLVERDRRAVAALKENLAVLACADAEVIQTDALAWLARTPATAFDGVFLDPPFASDLLAPAAEALEAGGWLAPEAWIYVESDALQLLPPLPASWRLDREQRSGQVRAQLYRRASG